MAANSLRRTLRPVVCVGYGADGANWLLRLEAIGRKVPLLADLLTRGVVQLWAIGTDELPERPGLRIVPPGADVEAIREMLDYSRRDELRVKLPGLQLQQLLVVERFSLYEAAADHRRWLWEALDAAKTLGQAEDETLPGFEIHWLTLMDGTWPGTAPGRERQQRAARNLRAFQPNRSLYIDRQSAAYGVVSRESADALYARLGASLLSSDLAFPRHEAGAEGVSHTLQTTAKPATATPIALVTLVHQRDSFEAQRAELLRRQLLRGPSDDVGAALQATYHGVPTLAKAFEAEIAQLTSEPGSFGVRARRQRAIEAVVARCLVELAPTDGKLAVKHLRDSISRQRALLVSAKARQHSAAFLGAVAPIGGRTIVLLLAAVLLVGWFLRRRSAARPGATGEAVPRSAQEDGSLALNIERSVSDWERIAQALDGMFERYEQQLQEWHESPPSSHVDAWSCEDAAAYQWCLVSEPLNDTSALASVTLYEQVVQHVAADVLRQSTEADLLMAALRRCATRDCEDPYVTRACLGAALTEPSCRPVREAVREAALLASVLGNMPVREVAWLVPPDADHQQLLRDLEMPQLQSAVRALVGEQRDRSVRLAFGPDVEWHRITSLSFLEGSGQ